MNKYDYFSALTGERKVEYLGNVYEDPSSNTKAIELLKEISNYNKLYHEPCCDCVYNRICISCAGINNFKTGNIYLPDKSDCDKFRNLMDKVITGVAKGALNYSEPAKISEGE